MKRHLSFVAALGMCSFAPITATYAQQIRAETGGIAISGSVTGSTIKIGVPPEPSAAPTVLRKMERNAIGFVRHLLHEPGLWIVASKADEYRRRAQQCLEMSGTFRDREARATLSHMAQVWLRLADDYEHANVRFGGLKAAGEGQPAVQQQQQIQPKKGEV